jgi:hypothetical protein
MEILPYQTRHEATHVRETFASSDVIIPTVVTI